MLAQAETFPHQSFNPVALMSAFNMFPGNSQANTGVS